MFFFSNEIVVAWISFISTLDKFIASELRVYSQRRIKYCYKALKNESKHRYRFKNHVFIFNIFHIEMRSHTEKGLIPL